jgi:hypothetical protein
VQVPIVLMLTLLAVLAQHQLQVAVAQVYGKRIVVEPVGEQVDGKRIVVGPVGEQVHVPIVLMLALLAGLAQYQVQVAVAQVFGYCLYLICD